MKPLMNPLAVTSASNLGLGPPCASNGAPRPYNITVPLQLAVVMRSSDLFGPCGYSAVASPLRPVAALSSRWRRACIAPNSLTFDVTVPGHRRSAIAQLSVFTMSTRNWRSARFRRVPRTVTAGEYMEPFVTQLGNPGTTPPWFIHWQAVWNQKIPVVFLLRGVDVYHVMRFLLSAVQVVGRVSVWGHHLNDLDNRPLSKKAKNCLLCAQTAALPLCSRLYLSERRS